MADLTIKYTEEMVGAGHPTKTDTLNRLALVEHAVDGTHPREIHFSAMATTYSVSSATIPDYSILNIVVTQAGTYLIEANICGYSTYVGTMLDLIIRLGATFSTATEILRKRGYTGQHPGSEAVSGSLIYSLSGGATIHLGGGMANSYGGNSQGIYGSDSFANCTSLLLIRLAA